MNELNDEQQQHLGNLEDIARDDPAEFDRDVSAYVHGRSPGDEAVFRHPRLARKTAESVTRLIVVEAQKRDAAAKGSGERRRRARRHEALTREMAELRPLLRRLDAESAASVRRRAERILGKVMYGDLRAVIGVLKAGGTEADGEALLRERLEKRSGKDE